MSISLLSQLVGVLTVLVWAREHGSSFCPFRTVSDGRRWALPRQVTILAQMGTAETGYDSVLEISVVNVLGWVFLCAAFFCGPSDAGACRLGLPLAVEQASRQFTR